MVMFPISTAHNKSFNSVFCVVMSYDFGRKLLGYCKAYSLGLQIATNDKILALKLWHLSCLVQVWILHIHSLYQITGSVLLHVHSLDHSICIWNIRHCFKEQK